MGEDSKSSVTSSAAPVGSRLGAGDRQLLMSSEDPEDPLKAAPSLNGASHEAYSSMLRGWVSKKFMSGCVILLPIAITFYVTWWFIQFVDGFFSPIYAHLGINIFGLGFVTSILFIFSVGVFVSSWVGANILSVGEWFIKRMPLIRHIYSASKQISAAISPDMEGSTLGLLVEFMERLGKALDNNTHLPTNRVVEIKAVFNRRWELFRKLLHAVAYMLHPLWRNEEQVYDEWQREQFEGYIQRWVGGDVEVLTRLEDDLLAFRNHAGDFSKVTARLRETQLQPVSWWEKYGVATPTLRRLAIRVLAQDCSSGLCERNWSTWALYHTKKRNMLSTAQLERLVYCNCNLKLLERNSTGPHPNQVNVDKIDIEKVRDIPEIPQEDRDLYTLLYEEATVPVHDTRASRRQRSRALAAVPTTHVATEDASSSSCSEDSHSQESSEDASDASDA